MFGGYTPIGWAPSGGGQKSDGTSFCFSIRDNNEVLKMVHKTGHDETVHSEDKMIAFSSTFKVFYNCDVKNKNSVENRAHNLCYNIPVG